MTEPMQPPVNDQTGEASPVVSGKEEYEPADVPASPTPEPPETPDTTAEAEQSEDDNSL